MSGALALVGGTPLAPGIDAWGGYSSSSPIRTSQLVRLVSGEPQEVVLGPDTPPALTHPRFLSGDTDWALACAASADAAYVPPATPDEPEDWGTLDPSLLSEIYTGADGRVLTLPDGCASVPHVTTETTRAESDTDAVERLRRQARTLFADAAQRRAVL